MYKKHIEHLATVGLKYFFDFDYTLFSHSFVMVILLFGISKLLFTNAIYTATDMFSKIKITVLNLKSRWHNTGKDDIPVYISSHLQKDIKGWHLK